MLLAPAPYPLPTFLFEEPLDVPQAVRSPTAKVWSTFVYPSYPRYLSYPRYASYILAIPGIPGIPGIPAIPGIPGIPAIPPIPAVTIIPGIPVESCQESQSLPTCL